MSNPIEQTGNYNRTERYKHIQTSDIVNKFASMGYTVAAQSQVKTRKVEKQGFQKHLLRFSNPAMGTLSVGDSRPEIVLINSHDGSSGYEMMMGIFRLVCANGLMVGSTFDSIKFRHSGEDINARIEKAVEEIHTNLPRIDSKIKEFQSIVLNDSQINEYANQAVKLILPKTAENVQLDSATFSRRTEDDKTDLWTVYNRLQESLVRGGVRFNTRNLNTVTNEVNVRNATSRQIRNIDRNVNINRQLWDLTESFAKVA